MPAFNPQTLEALRDRQDAILDGWLASLAAGSPDARTSMRDLEPQMREFWSLLGNAMGRDGLGDLAGRDGAEIRNFLEDLSRDRVQRGFSSSETAHLIFSLKRPLFEQLQATYADAPAQLAQELWAVSEFIDMLGLQTVKAYQQTREDVIQRQQEEMLELSTPVVKLWDGVLALPMIGTLDSQRTQVVMESLLQRIVETGAEIAIIDITGVPTVDTLVAQHLLKTVTAIRLMGADAIISGVRPQIAQTIVHLGLDLQGIVTKANLADALALALKRTGQIVTRAD